MPAIRQVQINGTSLTITDYTGVKTFTYSTIPVTQNTIAKKETWVNAWLAANVTTCQAVIHIFTESPLTLTVWTGNPGIAIPANWWLD